MGYTTDFHGEFKLNKKLDDDTRTFLVKLSETRRMKRKLPPEYGTEGEFFVDGKGLYGQDRDETILNYNNPPSTQPSLWCQWIPNHDGTAIEWDGREKFYDYVDWIKYLIENILSPRGYTLTGDVQWRGEDWEDTGTISITENRVTVF